MPDGARKKTDDILDKMEKHLYKVYNEAADDISKKWYKYMQSHERTLKNKYDALQEANKSGDKDAIKQAKEDYERAVKNVTLNNDRYNAMLNETTSKISHVNEVALDYVNGNTPKIYTLNYNEFANQDIDGYTFTLVNEQAVKELATKDKTLLPKKKLDVPKDKKWNEKQINSQVLQGILQGENITKIAKRLTTVTDMNRSSAIRNARTITTAAENKGRQDSFEKATNDGVIMDREWVTMIDGRERGWHAELNGVRVGIDEPWENEYGEIMYPGDPSADPANVYNCRCSIRANVKGFKWNEESKEDVEKETIDNTRVEHEVVNGKDISNTWQRRPDEFDFEIEDVINAQGFDGLPQVVPADEFNRYVEESNIIMQRTYTAPDQETLNAYRDQLYDGKWYVDCSTGGSAYGQGMYCCYDYGNVISETTKNEMIRYGANREFAYTETFTLLKDAKTITMSELNKIQQEYSSDIINSLMERGGFTNKEAVKWADERSHLVRDAGSFATALGYDAVIVDNGLDNYALILNRTKCIFKGE